VIVPFVTSAASTDATSAPCPCTIATPAVVRVVETRVADFDAAEEIPTVPAVRATVVMTIAATFFFVDIYMSPVRAFCRNPRIDV